MDCIGQHNVEQMWNIAALAVNNKPLTCACARDFGLDWKSMSSLVARMFGVGDPIQTSGALGGPAMSFNAPGVFSWVLSGCARSRSDATGPSPRPNDGTYPMPKASEHPWTRSVRLLGGAIGLRLRQQQRLISARISARRCRLCRGVGMTTDPRPASSIPGRSCGP